MSSGKFASVTLDVNKYRIESHSKAFPQYAKPAEIGCLCLNSDRQLKDDHSELRIFRPPPLGADLSDGYRDRYIEKDESNPENLDNLLRWLVLHKNELVVQHNSDDRNPTLDTRDTSSRKRRRVRTQLPFDFVAWRGALRKIMTTPYCPGDDWQFSIVKHNNTIFICEVETEQSKRKNELRNDYVTKCCFWGRRFEGYCTRAPSTPTTTSSSSRTSTTTSPTPTPTTSSTTTSSSAPTKTTTITSSLSSPLPSSSSSSSSSHVVDTNVEYVSVVKSKLNGKRLCFGGEVDCMEVSESSQEEPPPPLGKRNYVELKTSVLIKHPGQQKNFESKLLKFWAQSFLPNVPKVFVGFRDKSGYVVKTESFETNNIPKIVKGKNDAWRPSVCMNFLDTVLEMIKTTLQHQHEYEHEEQEEHEHEHEDGVGEQQQKQQQQHHHQHQHQQHHQQQQHPRERGQRILTIYFNHSRKMVRLFDDARAAPFLPAWFTDDNS